MRVFLAGATGVIGIRLLPLLAGCGHQVAGMTHSHDKTTQIAALGATPVVSGPATPHEWPSRARESAVSGRLLAHLGE